MKDFFKKVSRQQHIHEKIPSMPRVNKYFYEDFIFAKLSRNGKITLSFIDVGKLCLSREFFTSLICLLMLFAKIKFS